MANYKAQNWTPEKMADYGQRIASGQGYTDAERTANYQQQQKSFGQYADQPQQDIDEARKGDTNFGSTVTQGSWVVYDGSKVKRFKSRDGAKAYAAKNGGKVASSEFYADNVQKQSVAEGNLQEFAPGDGNSGRWYSDDDLADIVGEDWYEFDVSHEMGNIGTQGERARIFLAREAEAYLNDRGYNVNVLDVRDQGDNLSWYISGSLMNEQGVVEGSVQDKLHRRHQELRKKSGLPDPDYYKELKATYDLPDQERYAKAAELKKKYQVKEARKPEVNFDVEDLKKLERIRDLPTLKTLAFELISKPSERPMKPEKVEWFRSALERMDSPLKVIKLMYDLLLSGEGHAVIGSKNSMKSNTYRDRFGESTDGSVKYEFTLADGKKDYQTSKPANPGEKVKVDPKSAATIYQMNNPLRKIKSVKVVDEPKEEKSQVTNEDVERYIEELERAGYNILEEKTRLDPKCWKGYRKAGTKMKGDVRVNNCVPIKKKVDEYGAANGPPNLNKSDIKRMMPQQPVAEQIPTITDTGPREQPHPAAQALGLVRGLKKLSGIDKSDVENAVNQEITNIVRSPHDPSSENVSIINRLFGPRR
jgi:hypothetical protein